MRSIKNTVLGKEDNKKETLPLHLSQKEIYNEQVLDPNSSEFNVGGYIVLKGKLDKVCFIDILKNLPEVFDILRIHFDFNKAIPKCHFSNKPQKIEVNQISFTGERDPKKLALNWMQEQFNRPFDLFKKKLFENYLLQISENEYWWYMSYHHLILDGYGFGILIQYVANKYSSSVNLRNPTKEIDFTFDTYQDEIAKSLEYLSSDSFNDDISYWKKQFINIPEPLPKKHFFNHSGNKVHRTSIFISERDKRVYEEITKKTRTSLQQLTLAALIIYFARFENQYEIVFGVPLHKRRNKRQRNIVGPFSGVIPFKGIYTEDQTIYDFLNDIKKRQRSDYRHQACLPSYINKELNLLSKGRTQLFDIIVNYETMDFSLNIDGINSEAKHLSSNEGSTPLSIRWCDYGNNQPLEIKIDYKYSYFSKKEIELLMSRVLFIMRQFKVDTGGVGNLSILTSREEKELLYDFNDTAIDYPLESSTILDLFENQAVISPENIAIFSENNSLTYKELNDRSNKLAHYLKENYSLEADDLVAIKLDKSEWSIISVLAVLKSGSAYVPIDLDYPQERIDYIIEDIDCKVVIDDEELRKFIDVSNKYSIENLNLAIKLNDLAYVIYTSGSTGKPKGVLIEHDSLLNIALCWREEYNLEKESVVLQTASFSFDVFTGDLCRSLINGSKLVLCPKEVSLDSKYFYEFIKAHKVSVLELTPKLAIPHFDFVYENNLDVSFIELLILGSDTLQGSEFKNLLERFGAQMRIINSYGTTETTIDSSYYEVPVSKNIVDNINVPIGRPLANTEIYILNKSLQALPIGVIGELCIAGLGVSRGYLNRPDLTQEKFIKNPFGKGRLYKTGDLARWLPDGNIEFLGRADDQVKIRGYRIELGEIENVLADHNLVLQSCVLCNEDSRGHKYLAAYIVCKEDLNTSLVQQYLISQLPNYMVPSVVVFLDALPITPNGKIDKKALPAPDPSEIVSDTYVAPSTPIEIELASIWEELLNLKKIGIHDNFFELGGHSLLVMRLVSIVRKQLKVELTVKDIFEKATIFFLSHFIQTTKTDVVLPDILTGIRPVDIPLSFSQERLWFLDKLEGSTSYHISSVLRLSGSIDISILELSFRDIVDRHEVLRTIYKESEEGFVSQEVLDKGNWKFSSCIEEPQEDLISSLISNIINTPYDLSRDHILRVSVIEISPIEHILVLVMHHIASDGWSLP
ncbi:non-ribosomal peptide synthetase, partial [Aquimarina sp. I32.4]|uniref:non-ribosomal peptide synthetase n=1 Tax=Aquimarina sp. I32.4 TaxID=2053903 RepID=UPI0011AF342F